MTVGEHKVNTTSGTGVLFGQLAMSTLNFRVINSYNVQNTCAYVYVCMYTNIYAYKTLYKIEFQQFLRQASPW